MLLDTGNSIGQKQMKFDMKVLIKMFTYISFLIYILWWMVVG